MNEQIIEPQLRSAENAETVEIRPMAKEDLAPLAEIYTEVYRVFDVGEKWDKETAEKMLGYCFEHQPDLAFVAEYQRKPVGAFMAGVKPWWDGNHLIDGEIFIDPEYQQKGIGTKLLKTMFQTAKDKYQATVWDTYTFRGKYPLEWYKKLGFEEIDEWIMISGDIDDVLKKLE